MATNLIITVGLRDVQMTVPIEGIDTYKPKNSVFYCLSEVKDSSKYLIENFEQVQLLICFPIIEPAINHILCYEEKIDKIVLVSTNQENEEMVEEYHKKNDTLNVAKLLEVFLRAKFKNKISQIKHKVVQSNVIFYDDMYDFFNKAFSTDKIFRFDADDYIALFAQSGIDAINIALLLNCIENYPGTKQLTKPENSNQAIELNFPQKFYHNLLKVRLLNSLENYNYSAIADLNYNINTVLLAKYAYSRITFDFDAAINSLKDLIINDPGNRMRYISEINSLEFNGVDHLAKQREMYLSAKILLRRRAYSDFLVRVFTLFEILLKPVVERLLDGKVVYREPDHKEWNKLIEKNEELIAYLKEQKIGTSPLRYQIPSKLSYKAIYNYFNKDKIDPEFQAFHENLKILSDLRNSVAHDMVKVNDNDIQKELKRVNSSLSEFETIADRYFSVTGLGIYDDINNRMKQFL